MKQTAKRLAQLTGLAIMVLSFVAPLAAGANGNASLSASSATGTKGSAVSITISLDTAGTPAFAYQADLSYSTAFFSSASIAMSPGSPFTIDPGSQDPDVASGGNIHFTRFYTTSKNYSGPVATITLQSNGTVGSTSIDFKGICPSTSSTSNCSTVADGNNTQLLGSITNGNINLTNPPVGAAPAGGKASSSKGSKSKVAAATATTPAATTTTPAQTETKPAVTSKDDKTYNIVLTVLDQDDRPVKSAKVVVYGISGTTDANGKVTLKGLDPGTAQGNVYYGNQIIPISIKVNASEDTQVAKVNIKIKKSSAIVPISLGATVVIIAIAAFLIFSNRKKLASTPSVTVAAPNAPTPHVKTEFTEPLSRPEPRPAPVPVEDKISEKPKESDPLHEKAVDPGTVFTPTDEEKP
jgi:hypothetical protein